MYAAATTADDVLRRAILIVQARDESLQAALDALPAPIYVTDAQGVIIYFNKPCVEFAGRTPTVGQDRWCVTWKLFTDDGDFLPHDECPMAVAIQQKLPVRGATAVAERPDGSRVNFTPYPTPLLNEQGELIGAINMLVDITLQKQAEHLRAQALRCRRLAKTIGDRHTSDTLLVMAGEYEERARTIAT